MTKAEKTAEIAVLQEKFSDSQFFYLTDSSTLTVGQINKFRRLCFEKNVEMRVVKNSLIRKALEAAPASKGYEGLYETLKGHTAVLFTSNAKEPANIITEFRKDGSKPALKAAYIDTAIFIGDDQLETLIKLKSKEDLVGEIIGLLQSPAKNVISALKSGGSTIAGLLKTLEERAN